MPTEQPAPDSTTAGQLAAFAASERRAVKELGQDAEEYRWVSARVAEASSPAADGLGGLAGAIEASARVGREHVLETAAREQVPVAPGDDRSRDDSARAYNRDLLERYRAELDAPRAPAAVPSPPLVPPRS